MCDVAFGKVIGEQPDGTGSPLRQSGFRTDSMPWQVISGLAVPSSRMMIWILSSTCTIPLFDEAHDGGSAVDDREDVIDFEAELLGSCAHDGSPLVACSPPNRPGKLGNEPYLMMPRPGQRLARCGWPRNSAHGGREAGVTAVTGSEDATPNCVPAWEPVTGQDGPGGRRGPARSPVQTDRRVRYA